jgi:NhaA family Na+:H+ antiporter
MKLTKLFTEFFNSEKAGGFILIACTLVSLLLANSIIGSSYQHLWHYEIATKPIEFWVNDLLMTVFFLLVGLEIEREIYIGELAQLKKSMLPVFAAIGGMLVPAGIHYALNAGQLTQQGIGIPMATDIAFSLGVLSLLGRRVPASAKIFLTALAIIDDLGAIIIIALFYSHGFSFTWLSLAAGLFIVLIIFNRLKIHRVWVYLLIGAVMWYCFYRSGIHATISGVLLAFAIPFGSGNEASPSYRLQHRLHNPVAFFILPLFAIVNTAIAIPDSWFSDLLQANSLGIMLGLIAGKPLGILIFSILAVSLGICTLPVDLKKRHLLSLGLLAGIGFTMSIFIAMLAFDEQALVDTSKIAIMVGSLIAGILGLLMLGTTLPKRSDVLEDSDA